MAVREPMASHLQKGEGQYVTVGIRGTSGPKAHTMIKIGNQYYESGGGHGPAKVKGWNGSFEKFHPKGYRKGGRVGGRRFRSGGRVSDPGATAVAATAAGGDASDGAALGLMGRAWAAIRHLLPRGNRRPGIRFFSGKGVPYTDGSNVIHWNRVDNDDLLSNGRAEFSSWAKNALIHEFAHTRQRLDLPTWQSEGGAQAWADMWTPRTMAQLGMRYQPGGSGNYAGHVQRVNRELGRRFVTNDQFRGAATRGQGSRKAPRRRPNSNRGQGRVGFGSAQYRLGFGRPNRGRGRGRGAERIASILDRIATGNTRTVKSALTAAEPIIKDRGNLSNLMAWIAASDRRMKRKGITATGRKGLEAFAYMARETFENLIGLGLAPGEAAIEGFDQADTDLQNRQIIHGATEAQALEAGIAQDVTQVTGMRAQRVILADRLRRAQRGRNVPLVRELQGKLSALDSSILAGDAGIVQGRRQLVQMAADAAQAEKDALVEAMERNTEAQKAHTEALNGVQAEIKRQTDVAVQLNNTETFQLKKAFADVLSGQIGGMGVVRSYTPGGSGVAHAY
jgi:hypothetical protein